MAKKIQAAEIGKRLFPIVSEQRSFKGPNDKLYTKDELAKMGLETDATVVIPMFTKEDFKSVGDFKRAIDRVFQEWETARKLITDNGGKLGDVLAVGKDGKEYILADPTSGDGTQRFLDFMSETLHSGISLAHQQVAGARMRNAAKAKIGTSSGAKVRGSRADVEI
jgi:hypothetical protein